jgi:hypothetical protein
MDESLAADEAEVMVRRWRAIAGVSKPVTLQM